MMKKSFLLLALVAIVAGVSFAQRVGDTIQHAGSSWTIESVSGDTFTVRKVVAQGDGPVNWVAVPDSTFGTTQINGVAWGNNTWVAVGNAGKIAYSADGRSWTAVPAGTGAGQSTIQREFWAVAFGNNMFIAVGYRGSTAYSTDGRTWTAVANSTFGNNDATSVAFGGGRWVAVGQLGKTAYSTDGRTWTAVDATNAFGTSNNRITAVAYGNNRFVAVGQDNKIAYSSNGASWTAVANPPSGSWLSIAYGGNRFVAGGFNGRIAYSPDGVAWTNAPLSRMATGIEPAGFNFNQDIDGVAFGNNRYVAVGENGRMGYSTDGSAWTGVANSTFPTGSNDYIQAVAYGNGRFVAVGTGGRMAYCDW